MATPLVAGVAAAYLESRGTGHGAGAGTDARAALVCDATSGAVTGLPPMTTSRLVYADPDGWAGGLPPGCAVSAAPRAAVGAAVAWALAAAVLWRVRPRL